MGWDCSMPAVRQSSAIPIQWMGLVWQLSVCAAPCVCRKLTPVPLWGLQQQLVAADSNETAGQQEQQQPESEVPAAEEAEAVIQVTELRVQAATPPEPQPPAPPIEPAAEQQEEASFEQAAGPDVQETQVGTATHMECPSLLALVLACQC